MAELKTREERIPEDFWVEPEEGCIPPVEGKRWEQAHQMLLDFLWDLEEGWHRGEEVYRGTVTSRIRKILEVMEGE